MSRIVVGLVSCIASAVIAAVPPVSSNVAWPEHEDRCNA